MALKINDTNRLVIHTEKHFSLGPYLSLQNQSWVCHRSNCERKLRELLREDNTQVNVAILNQVKMSSVRQRSSSFRTRENSHIQLCVWVMFLPVSLSQKHPQHQNVQAEVFQRKKKFPMMLSERSVASLSRLLQGLWVLFHIQWFSAMGRALCESMLPSFSHLCVFQPADDTSEPVTMETTLEENLSFNLSPLPFPLDSENFNLQKLKLKEFITELKLPGVPLSVVFGSTKT